MELLNKIIWAEGVFLGQQHFQQWDRYLEYQERLRIKLIAPFAWGLQKLIIDEEALLNGQFRVKKLQGIYPDGQLFNYDYTEEDTLTCSINSSSSELITIYLGLPNNQQTTGITGYQHVRQFSTWRASYQQIADLYDNNRSREVLFGKLNLLLLQDNDDQRKCQCLKIAEVKSNGKGGYQLINTFIPTLLNIKASNHLQGLLTRWIELIMALMRLLKERGVQFNNKAIDFVQNDLENFLLLHTLSQFLPNLLHYQKHTEIHPQHLFLTISQLIASLGAYQNNFLINDMPYYQHENLSVTFSQLDVKLRTLLEAVMPMRMLSLKLRRETETLYLVDGIDGSAFLKTQFFIAAFFQAEDAQWITQFARQIKVGSAQAIDSIVTSALPGVKVTHMQRPPSKLSIKTGYEYFYLEPNGNFWEQIKAEKSMGIFVPFNFSTAAIELVTVQE